MYAVGYFYNPTTNDDTTPGETSGLTEEERELLEQVRVFQPSVQAWYTTLHTWKTNLELWKTGIDAWKLSVDQWKPTVDALLQPQTVAVTVNPSFPYGRLRPPGLKVVPNTTYVCYPESNDIFLFHLYTHGSAMDAAATQSFEFTVFNGSGTWDIRVLGQNNRASEPILFVRRDAWSTQMNNTRIRPRTGMRFLFIPYNRSPYARFGQVCPAFLEWDLHTDPALTLSPVNNNLIEVPRTIVLDN